MKTINLFLIYIGTFISLFFLLSLIGLLWEDSYLEVTGNTLWFMLYSLFIGWWTAGMAAREYYSKHEDYFEQHL